MSQSVNTVLDFGNANRIANLAPAAANGQPVIYEQLNAATSGLAWKDNCRACATVNINIATPGASIDSVTLASGDRVLLPSQTTQTQNGIYIWNGAATPMTRASDSSTFDSLESAVVTVDEGTSNAGVTYRQTQVNGVIGTNNIIWTNFIPASPVSSETTAGIIQIATQTETDTGTDNTKAVTPAKLANWSGKTKRASAVIGDNSNTSFAINHNFNTRNLDVIVNENSGSYRRVMVEIQYTSLNTITIICDSAPASNAYNVVIVG